MIITKVCPHTCVCMCLSQYVYIYTCTCTRACIYTVFSIGVYMMSVYIYIYTCTFRMHMYVCIQASFFCISRACAASPEDLSPGTLKACRWPPPSRFNSSTVPCRRRLIPRTGEVGGTRGRAHRHKSARQRKRDL